MPFRKRKLWSAVMIKSAKPPYGYRYVPWFESEGNRQTHPSIYNRYINTVIQRNRNILVLQNLLHSESLTPLRFTDTIFTRFVYTTSHIQKCLAQCLRFVSPTETIIESHFLFTGNLKNDDLESKSVTYCLQPLLRGISWVSIRYSNYTYKQPVYQLNFSYFFPCYRVATSNYLTITICFEG